MLLIAVGDEVRRFSLAASDKHHRGGGGGGGGDYGDVVVAGRRIQALSVDTGRRVVYWTDSADRAVRRAAIPPGDDDDERRRRTPPPAVVQTLRTGRSLHAPAGIALDWVAQ